MMTFDGGWGYILSTCIGVVLMWIGGLVTKHFNKSEDSANEANIKVDALEKKFLEYKAHVAEYYPSRAAMERMESNIYVVMQRIESKVDELHNRRD